MKKLITKTVVIISAVSVALGIALCAAGAAANGSLGNILDRFNIHIERGNGNYHGSYSVGGDDAEDFFDDFFGDDFDDFFNDGIDTYGGENNDASL